MLGPLNQPGGVGLAARLDGYWANNVSATVVVDQTTTVNLDMIKVCDNAAIVGTVINLTTQLPIANAHVDAGGGGAFTDAAGTYSVPAHIGLNNSAISVLVTATADGFLTQSKMVTIFCGATIVVDFGRASTAVGVIEGTVSNGVTNQPIAGAFVGSE